MKSSVYAYAIGTFHMKEKISVFTVKDLARSSCDLKNGVRSQDEKWC